jgi:hypothetical protein
MGNMQYTVQMGTGAITTYQVSQRLVQAFKFNKGDKKHTVTIFMS